jgi:predicted TIM-barrel fold metal-dependent hydrolase
MVWGSDWPHVAHPGSMPNVGELLDLLGDWVPDPAQRDAILAANPARLYGFG